MEQATAPQVVAVIARPEQHTVPIVFADGEVRDVDVTPVSRVHARQKIDARYRDAAARHPETAEEITDARRLAEEVIAEEPWERWW
jgi:hypothetical protein